MSDGAFPAFRFDGRSAAGLPVLVHIDRRELIVAADGAEIERQPIEHQMFTEPFAHAPRLIAMRSGATLEVPDPEQRFWFALEEAGIQRSLPVRLQEWWPAAVGALAILCALSGLIYFKWLPGITRWAAFALSPGLEQRMGRQVLSVLDQHYLEPSRLEEPRRTALAERLARGAALAAPGVEYRLEFRFGEEKMNAMALPGGTIVLLDDLVTFAEHDDRVLAVLGHELGHVVHKHGARQVLQSVGVGALASLLWGDFSGVAASVPLVIGMLQYSRDFEREADEFSVSFLHAQGLSSRPLYEFFERLNDYESKKGLSAIPDFISSHPSTEERLTRLKDGLDSEDP